MIHLLVQWISLFLVYPTLGAQVLQITPLAEEGEVDIRYKKQLPIYLQHDLGDVQIQGWNQDLIRVKIKKTLIPPLVEEPKKLFSSFDLISLETPQAIEIRIGTPQGTDLLSKLRTRNLKSKIKVDLEIRAPATLPLSLVLGEGRTLKLSQWKGKLELTGKNNQLEWNKLKITLPLMVNCQDCSLNSEDSELSGNLLLRNQDAKFKNTRASPGILYVDLQEGALTMDATSGDYRVRSTRGNVTSVHHVGPFQIQTQSGKVSLQDFQGDLNLESSESEIKVHAIRIDHHFDVKNRNGPITLSLPGSFSGRFDLQSIGSEVSSEFTVKKTLRQDDEYGPEIRGKFFGKVGDPPGPLVSIFSESGSIFVKRREVEL